jgi:hypothetical protein
MDIENSAQGADWRIVFGALQPQTKGQPQKNHTVLQNTFNTAIDAASDAFTLTLTHDRLLLASAERGSSVPLAEVSLAFDLKFEVLHQNEVRCFSFRKTSGQPKSVSGSTLRKTRAAPSSPPQKWSKTGPAASVSNYIKKVSMNGLNPSAN